MQYFNTIKRHLSLTLYTIMLATTATKRAIKDTKEVAAESGMLGDSGCTRGGGFTVLGTVTGGATVVL